MRMFGVYGKSLITLALNGNAITEAQKNLFKRMKYGMININFPKQFKKISYVWLSGTDLDIFIWGSRYVGQLC